MGISSYKKLKFLINKLLKNEVICKDLEEFSTMDISESTYAKFVTKLNDIKIIQPLSKGENIIKNEFLNHFYFNDKEKNLWKDCIFIFDFDFEIILKFGLGHNLDRHLAFDRKLDFLL